MQSALDGLATLEADATYGSTAAAFNDHVNAEWIASFADNPVSLVGVPDHLVELGTVG